MKDRIIECAKACDADIVGFASADRFDRSDALFRIFPDVKTVIGLGFRVLRGSMRGVEEGTTYYQYTTMGVENLEETVMPMALLRVSALLEAEGYLALPQRRNPLILNEEGTTNPEVDYTDVVHGVKAEAQLDFLSCAVKCGLGEESRIHTLLTPEYGPFVRYCFVLTDAEIEPTEQRIPSLCDGCGECMRACPGHAISEDGTCDTWRCAVYYNGAAGRKNPFMPPDALLDFDDRLAIIDGSAEMDPAKARDIIDHLYFYPPAKHFYRTSICGRACDRACYIHLEEKGVLTKSFRTKFREGEDWQLSDTQFTTLTREKPWEFTKQ